MPSILGNSSTVFSPILVTCPVIWNLHPGSLMVHPLQSVLYSKDLSEDEQWSVHSNVYEIITDLLSTDDIDLINLNTAPLAMQYGVIKQAKILVLNNKAEYIDFWEQTVKYYLDFKPLLDECNQALLESLTGRSVHG